MVGTSVVVVVHSVNLLPLAVAILSWCVVRAILLFITLFIGSLVVFGLLALDGQAAYVNRSKCG